MPVDRRLLQNLDWTLVATSFALTAIGLLMILSATRGHNAALPMKQLAAIGIALVFLLFFLIIDYRQLVDRSPLFYVLTAFALIYVLMFGPRIAGTRRWLIMGGIQIQPSEIAKIVAALVITKIFSDLRKESLGLGDLLLPGVLAGLYALLIAAEPDLGTAFCMVPLFLGTAFVAGLRARALVAIFIVLVVIAGLGWTFALKDYQKSRIYSFLDPNLDPKGAGYQKIQSEIAVGSGGLTGKGYLKGTQVQLGYLPARHTDFIFSVVGEEFGFLGVASVLGLYLLILWRALETAHLARDRTGALLATAITAILAFQVMYNVAMVGGLVPVKGLPLPFMSYGGSSIIFSFSAIGLILNVRMRRFAN